MRAEDKEREDGDVPVVARCDQAWALLVSLCEMGSFEDELDVFHGGCDVGISRRQPRRPFCTTYARGD